MPLPFNNTRLVIPQQLRLPGHPRVRLPREQERHARLRLLLQEHRRHGRERRLQVPAGHVRRRAGMDAQGGRDPCRI